MLSVVLADNQAPVAAALERGGLAWALGEGTALTPTRLTSALRELLADQPRRAEMSRRGQALIDGRGPQRVVGEMLKIRRSGSAAESSSLNRASCAIAPFWPPRCETRP